MEMSVLKLWDYWALISIIFIGIPHGALDGAISITLGYSKKLKLQLAFISIYIFIAFVIIMFWIYFPVIALTLFLFLSVFHFGLGDLVWKNSKFYLLKGYFHGGLFVFGIIFLNTSEVDIIFKNIIRRKPIIIMVCFRYRCFYLGSLMFFNCFFSKKYSFN